MISMTNHIGVPTIGKNLTERIYGTNGYLGA